jgi:hypothetical protein
MMFTKYKLCRTGALSVATILFGIASLAPYVRAESAQPKYSADVPSYITTPDSVKTRIGTLKFKNGAPDPDTVKLVYDQVDFSRGIQAFLTAISGTSVYAACEGLIEAGVKLNKGTAITENLMDARSLFLTPNTTTVYVISCIDLKDGPVIAQVPPEVLGPVDDGYFRWVTDVGLTGPDKGKGGKYLFVPPGYEGDIPSDSYHVAKPLTNRLVMFYRAFVKDGDIQGAVARVKENANIYPLSKAGEPPTPEFVNISGMKFNTISSNTFRFYEELDAIVQNEPADFVDPDTVGLFASIGIVKGKPFAPDTRLKAILTDAVAVANGIARANLFASRDPRTKIYADRQWVTPFVGGSYQFLDGAERLLDARAMFFYYATGITPAMTEAKPGTGSAYAGAFRDSEGKYFDGSNTYKINMPAPIPANNFWAFTVYDNQTRSLLETDQKTAGVDSNDPDMKKNADGSVTIWFGPKAPIGKEKNWIQTIPGKGWNVLLRLYGPLEPWFNKTWKPGDIELLK